MSLEFQGIDDIAKNEGDKLKRKLQAFLRILTE
jgi:hypothetical protein